ncbi:MAG: AAA family ATPase [Pirellulaceae bacterium]
MDPTTSQQVPGTEPSSDGANPDEKLDMLLARINTMANGSDSLAEPGSAAPVPAPSREEVDAFIQDQTPRARNEQLSRPSEPEPKPSGADACASGEDVFVPRCPRSFEEAKLSESKVEELVLKYLLARGDASGRKISEQIKLPFILIEKFLNKLKLEQVIAYIGQATMNDYICRLTDIGTVRARGYSNICTYYGAAPVCLQDYCRSVKSQSIDGHYPSRDELSAAFSDLLIDEAMLQKLGPAVSSGRGMFLYGFPGNGKTSIAERVTKSFGPYIWIPRAMQIEGEIVRLFDPMCHEPAPMEESDDLMGTNDIDERWVRIKRPTIVVGGELTMDHLEITYNSDSGISEAPIQLKSNCGILVIDDFGRQKMRVDELLNRWIVPLEKRYDYLNLTSGKKIQVPFDQLVIFSTNLEPRDLVDDAFMRRIPYKIEVEDPSLENFIKLFEIMSKVVGIPYDPAAVEYLIKTHYEPTNRPLRNCQPRDLLLQIRNYCNYNKLPLVMSKESFDFAADCYFSVM